MILHRLALYAASTAVLVALWLNLRLELTR
jgi:hypothetical protein